MQNVIVKEIEKKSCVKDEAWSIELDDGDEDTKMPMEWLRDGIEMKLNSTSKQHSNVKIFHCIAMKLMFKWNVIKEIFDKCYCSFETFKNTNKQIWFDMQYIWESQWHALRYIGLMNDQFENFQIKFS